MPKTPSATQVGKLPKTFNDRGMSIQFTSEAIGYARLRQPAGNAWEALIPGLSGGKGTYVIPWKQVPELFSLTMHDRALHEQLSAVPQLSPYHVRRMFLNLEAEGYSGADAAEAAQKALDKEKETRLLTHYTLVMQVLDKFGSDDDPKIKPNDLLTEAGREQVRHQMNDFAHKHKVTSETLMNIMEEWADLLSAVGSMDGRFSGYLTECMVNLNNLTAELKEWAIEEPAETAAMSQRICDAATLTSDLAFKMKGQISEFPQDFEQILINWDAQKADLEKMIAQLSWILDGWQKILRNWEKSKTGFRYEQRQTVEESVQFIPMLPQEALNVPQQSIWSKIKEFQSRFVRVHVNWLTDEVDHETMSRVQGYPMEDS